MPHTEAQCCILIEHSSLEGVGGVIRSEVRHLKADISLIPETQRFENLWTPLQNVFWFIQHISYIACSTGNTLMRIPTNRVLSVYLYPTQQY